MENTRPSVMEVDLKAFKHNIEQIKLKLSDGTKIMPVIKANAYGTHINNVLEILNEFDIVAVALVEEGEKIRNLGYDKDIFILNQPYKEQIEKIIENNLIVGVSSNEFVEELGKIDKPVKVHVEIGTGMGRTGIKPSRAQEYIDKIKKYSNITVDGVYTHLSSADYDDEYTKNQISSFEKAVEVIKNEVSGLRYIHAAASNAILNHPNSHYNLVRPGIIMYGYPSASDTLKKIDLKPVAKLKSKIVLIKTVPANTSIGYSRSYITESETKVATVPMGYADGIRRSLSNGWNVVINGQKVPIIGKVCMDSFMVDVTKLSDVKIGDEVYIWDNESIKLEDIAEKCDTINYEILCTISNRVPRNFKK